MNTQHLLIVIAVLLLGILTVIVIQTQQKSPGDKIADSISEVTEEISDEIDDNTTN
jgi:hypothetical protein